MSAPAARIPVMVPWLGEEEARAASEAVLSGWVAQGPRVAEFERAFAERVGAEHGIAVSSCTTALHLALIALDLGPGDEVIVPSLSFIATANAVRYVGAHPVFADVEEATGNLTPATVDAVRTPARRRCSPSTRAGSPRTCTRCGRRAPTGTYPSWRTRPAGSARPSAASRWATAHCSPPGPSTPAR